MINKAFLKFDIPCIGKIYPDDLKKVFSCREHPKVITGEMSED